MNETAHAKNLPSLYLIADRETCAPRDLEDVFAEALDAGVRLVQLREKQLETREAPSAGVAPPATCQKTTTRSCSSTRMPGSHGTSARPASIFRHTDPPRREFDSNTETICSSAVQPTTGRNAGRPTAPTLSLSARSTVRVRNRDTGPGAGAGALRRATEWSSLPVYALGGITPGRVAACKENGAAGIAVMSGILAADDIPSAVTGYIEAWASAPGPRHPQPS